MLRRNNRVLKETAEITDIIRVLGDNADHARSLVGHVVAAVKARNNPCSAGCHRALENALITASEARDRDVVSRLDAVAGRVLNN